MNIATIRKTDECVIARLNKHSSCLDQPMFHHLQYCKNSWHYISYLILILILSNVNLQVQIDGVVSVH